MTPQDANSLQRDDVVLFQSQTWRVTEAFANGYMLRLRGKHGNTEVFSAKCQLVYRRDAVPPNFTVNLLNAEEEATIRAAIAERRRNASTEQEG